VTNAWLAAGLGVVVAVDLVLAWIVLGPAIARRLDGRGAGRLDGGPGGTLDLRAIAALEPASLIADGLSIAAYDRVVRVASWVYLLSTALIVYVTGLWPEAEEPLLLVLAIGGVFILIAHDVLPSAGLASTRLVIEGAVAITLVSLVVALTGGATSPFFYAYALVVAGAALVVRPSATVVLAGLAIGGYLLAAAVATGGAALDDGEVAIAAVNLTALLLLAYVAAMVAREQRRTRDAALRLSTVDALTGLANRAYVLAAVEREIDRATRYRHRFCILLADLDGLKELNDTLGHRAGDRALAAVAAVIRENIRRIDTPARLGGDEFVVLLPETDRDGARVVAEKIRQGVAAVRVIERDRRVTIGVSVGVGEWAPGRTIDDVMAEADDAMYRDKRRPRGPGSDDGAGLTPVGPGWPGGTSATGATVRERGVPAGRS
jgi:diguanylate cyclase (GGDEF)-like protein